MDPPVGESRDAVEFGAKCLIEVRPLLELLEGFETYRVVVRVAGLANEFLNGIGFGPLHRRNGKPRADCRQEDQKQAMVERRKSVWHDFLEATKWEVGLAIFASV